MQEDTLVFAQHHQNTRHQITLREGILLDHNYHYLQHRSHANPKHHGTQTISPSNHVAKYNNLQYLPLQMPIQNLKNDNHNCSSMVLTQTRSILNVVL